MSAPPQLTASAVAELVGGRLQGNGAVPLLRLAPLDSAGPDALSFLLVPGYLPNFLRSRAGAVLLPLELAETAGGPLTRIVVADPVSALTRIALVFQPEPPSDAGVSTASLIAADAVLEEGVAVGPFATVEPGARIGARSRIGAGARIGAGVEIGPDCVVGPNAVCYPGTRLGARVRLKAGAVIGGEGFGYVRGAEGHRRVPHLGRCVLEDDVEVGSGSCIDRGNFEDTVVGRGTKIDNLVQVGHNVRLGERCLIMATAGIAGSCRIGNDVVIAGGVGIADHVTVGDGAVIGAKSVVFGPGRVPAGAVVSGFPARPHRSFLRAQAALYRLSEHVEALESLAEGAVPRAAPDARPGS